ncbi:FAD-dependent monooxygenase [Solirubrobacter sp. CPCC 204708]|uniref:FAD-dependent monooxygenase n=1 Tax=Solirubrobacter deserti TaxID=2282478 RepID=A0ABT4RDC3_9ACTN|nr:FAD-dependent monooxygenase [Solirubrobacter deserti]MBE2314537.1 FAD-dependent monooxygenase [Solirubrobacter deserti]MDA0136541.1 FAD-dependent monooxygenase [Solirubrobacter deserti]
MRIAIAGGGPGGLYLSILLKRLDPSHEVVVHERNAPDDTFGFGVVFSDETLAAFEAADPESYAEIAAAFVRWSEIDVHYRGEVVTSGGHGFSAMGRKDLLGILQRRAAGLGVELHFRSEVAELEGDLVVAADGVNSTLRAAYGFEPRLDRRRATYAWFGTDHVFDAFTFIIAETPRGVVQVHAYPYSDTRSTFIVESTGVQLDRAQCEDLFGYRLIENRTRWINFVTVRNPFWRREHVVLLGDAAHTAHFSIGSGTKLAMEDAISLAWAVREGDIDAYEAERRPIVESTQRAAQGSLEWFEGIGRYVHQEPRLFAFNLLTRSRRITYGELRKRDPDFVASVAADPPMFTPFTLRGLTLRNRVVVSPMDMYSSVDGTPGDFHLVHLGARALGGAGLVMTEMICTSAAGRITPGCGGLYAEEHTAAWKRIVDFVHTHSRSAIGCQLGHSGRKGSTKLMWEGDNEPLDEGNWPLIAPSPIPWDDAHQTPREMTRADMDDVRDQFVAATRRAAAAGFDLLELHMAHGYLLSSFLSPRTNVREDEYGTDRAKFPLEVLAACRAVWDGPLSVRISATDWVDGGFDGDAAVAFARRLQAAGCDIVDVSTGQVVPDQQPAYGRSYQTPYADRIRNEVGMPVIAVGAISSYDDVNTIILAGRADLCALARPHLWDPHWTLHAAAEQGVEMEWIPQYRSGAREPQTGKDVRRMPLRRFDEVHA